MKDEEIFDRLRSIVSNQLGVESDKVVRSAAFTSDLGADSLDVVELVMAFEDEFGIEIEDTEAGSMVTVENAVEYISKKMSW